MAPVFKALQSALGVNSEELQARYSAFAEQDWYAPGDAGADYIFIEISVFSGRSHALKSRLYQLIAADGAAFATGVTILTTRTADGSVPGLAISSFNSVSLDPPLVLWSLSNRANSLPIFPGNSHYAINVLGAHQKELAERCARRCDEPFAGVGIELSRTGQPILKGASAWFECDNRGRYVEGDHVIFIGEVACCAVTPHWEKRDAPQRVTLD